MKVWDKLLLFIYSLAVAAAAIVALVVVADIIPDDDIHTFVSDTAGGDRIVQIVVAAVAIVLLVLSVRMLIVALRGSSGGHAPSINQRTEHGEVRISIETVENLALKAASRTRGIKDLRARVKVAESGLGILIRAFVDGDSPIPALSEEIQRTVAAQVEEATGIPVVEVTVYIANVAHSPASFKSRVE